MMRRLHAVTRGRYMQPVEAFCKSDLVHMMRLLMMKQAASRQLSWHSAASGLLGLGLVGCRLLPSVEEVR